MKTEQPTSPKMPTPYFKEINAAKGWLGYDETLLRINSHAKLKRDNAALLEVLKEWVGERSSMNYGNSLIGRSLKAIAQAAEGK